MLRVFEMWFPPFLLLLLLLVNTTFADNSRNQTPAHLLAKQAGATLFEEDRYEAHTDCNDPNHQVKKRSSDEDVDYEVYQGVVGRPGIDFPIYPRIPKTSFSCRSYGNGYFADMETECQVFHICEDGRKISFLCPNGTIFQQSELTCDWWFKVNCLGSQGYYAESAEILNKQRVQRIRPSVPVQGFSIVGGATSSGLDIKPKLNNAAAPPRSQQVINSSQQRLDSSEIPSLESIDFEDISAERQIKERQSNKISSGIEHNNNDNESQITAETASFVGPNRHRNSLTEKAVPEKSERRHEDKADNEDKTSSKLGTARRGSQRHAYQAANLSSNRHSEHSERSRGAQRGKQRYRERDERRPTSVDSYESVEAREHKKKKQSPLASSDIGTKFNPNQLDSAAEAEIQPEYYPGPLLHNAARTATSSSTVAYSVGTYSTARRLESTRATPYYTPTIPSLIKSKAGEGKSFYIKGAPAVASAAAATAATTPSSHRYAAASGSGGLVVEATRHTKSAADAKSSSVVASFEAVDASDRSNVRPLLKGKRHKGGQETSSEIYRFNAGLPLQKTQSAESSASGTGPNYLPKQTVASATRSATSSNAAAGDSLLFAPTSPIDDVSIRRNVDEMLRTMNLLKSSMGSSKLREVDDAFKFQGQQMRTGLEIPPSSGPDALVSLAKYFANEPSHSDTTAHTLNAVGGGVEKPRVRSDALLSAANAASISTTALRSTDNNATIAAVAAISTKSDDINTSLLSEKTVHQYSNLFGLHEAAGSEPRSLSPNEGNASTSAAATTTTSTSTTAQAKKELVENPFPQIGSTDATIRSLADKPASRKIAQVFSNALTTYLENPVSFREQLASARPTEPPAAHTTLPHSARDGATLNMKTSSTATPTRRTPPKASYAAMPDVSTSPEPPRSIAVEINQKFDYSTQANDALASVTTESYDASTLLPAPQQQLQLELSAELVPPSPESGEGDEFLQREQTQSFVKSRNQLQPPENASSLQKKHKISLNAAFVEEPKTTESPWDHMSEGDFLDPLTINDGLMKEPRVTTISPFTYLPKEATTTRSRDAAELTLQREQRVATEHQSSSELHKAQYRQTAEASAQSWSDIFNTYDLPLESLPSSSGLQRIANKLFGGLNETEALHLRNVMQQAEHNRQVLSLLLLLIQTCDDQNGKALERSRKHLLNALIDMDGKLEQGSGANGAHQTTANGRAEEKSSSSSITPTTTGRIPVTTYRRSSEDLVTSTLAYLPTTTDQPLMPTTTTAATKAAASTVLNGSVEETTKFEIRVEDVEDVDLARTSATATGNTSDQRALELLKSLYSLASKFTSRR